MALADLIFPFNFDALYFADPRQPHGPYAEQIYRSIEFEFRMTKEQSFASEVCLCRDTLELINDLIIKAAIG